jgi:hypothetical protein
LSSAISFANADHAKSSFGTIASSAMRNNVGPDTPSCHRRPYPGGGAHPRVPEAEPRPSTSPDHSPHAGFFACPVLTGTARTRRRSVRSGSMCINSLCNA